MHPLMAENCGLWYEGDSHVDSLPVSAKAEDHTWWGHHLVEFTLGQIQQAGF